MTTTVEASGAAPPDTGRAAAAIAAPGRSHRGRLWRLGEQLGVLAAGIGVWELATVRADSFFFPPPSQIFPRVVENWFSGPASSLFLTAEVGRDVAPSLGRMLAGWLLAGVVGIAFGTVLGLARRLAGYVDPIIHFLRAAPGPALLPVFMVIFGIGTDMKIFFIAFGSVWPVLLNTMDGVRAVDPAHLDTAATFRIGTTARVVKVVLPAASPRMVAGLRISLAIALVLMVISDMVNSTGGFGFALIEAQRSFRILDLWAGIVLLALVGFTFNALFQVGERHLMAWHRGYRGRIER
jgi:ABC-type nitrate/sulfonate/bicarbonate transport system permease component